MFAANHRKPLHLADRDAGLVEAGFEHMFGEKPLPCGVRKHLGLLRIALRRPALHLHTFVFLDVLGIFDLIAVDRTDFRIVPRESHLGLQREYESQQSERDDDSQHDAEAGP